MFSSVLTGTVSTLSVTAVMICLAASLVCGLIVALTYRACEHTSKGFSVTLALLPAIVQMIILMVNGNLGVGVAVAGSFSLVRFRSLPGKASDILVIFLAMGLGLCTGMGYAVFAVASALILALVYAVFSSTSLFADNSAYRNMRITIPEDLDYAAVFDDILKKYAKKFSVESVRTVNLGTMYQIEYAMTLKDTAEEKNMIDEIRVRNGNLPVISSRAASVSAEL